MKEVKFKWFLATFALLLAMVGILSVTSCDDALNRNHNKKVPVYSYADSVYIAYAVQTYINPELSTPGDLAEYKQELANQRRIDDFIVNTPINSLQSVMHVLTKRGVTITPKSLYREYNSAKHVYEELASFKPEEIDIAIDDPIPSDSI